MSQVLLFSNITTEFGSERVCSLPESNRTTFSSAWTFVVLISLCTIYISEIYRRSSRATNLPHGPSGLPLVGNLLDFRAVRSDPKKFAQWALSLASYGEMTKLQMGSRTWIMLNSNRVAKGIIANHAAATGERPDFPVSGTLVSKDKRTVLRKTKFWRDGRKLMHHLLNGASVKSYAPIMERHSVNLLYSYLQGPQEWNKHHYDYAYSIAHSIVLGERAKHSPQQCIDFQRITTEFLRSIGSSVFDFLPSSRVFSPFLTSWSRMGNDHYQVFKDWWDPVTQDIANDTAPSFARDVLQRSDSKYAHDNDEAMYLVTSIVAAGSDNVRRAHNVMIMAAICHPDIVLKAREMIDSICSVDGHRLPTIEDMEALPYISAILKECLRWRPVVPLIPQHQSTTTIHFDGYTFPPGTDFVINSLAVSMEHSDSQQFKPERWMGRELTVTDGLWQFGGGRRVCVGYKIAHQELFLALSRTIYCFDIVAGGPIDSMRLRHDVMDEPFPVTITPRSPAHRELIQTLHDRA